MLCYLPCDTVVVINDINGNLTNLYIVIRDSPSPFVNELMKFPYIGDKFIAIKDALSNKTKYDYNNIGKLFV